MAQGTTQAPAQIEKNFEAFRAKLPDLLATHAGKVAVMHDGQIVDFFDTYADAVKFGLERYNDYGKFSVQEVSNHVISLGIYSYAGYIRQ